MDSRENACILDSRTHRGHADILDSRTHPGHASWTCGHASWTLYSRTCGHATLDSFEKGHWTHFFFTQRASAQNPTPSSGPSKPACLAHTQPAGDSRPGSLTQDCAPLPTRPRRLQMKTFTWNFVWSSCSAVSNICVKARTFLQIYMACTSLYL